jgi:hypothetical protein
VQRIPPPCSANPIAAGTGWPGRNCSGIACERRCKHDAVGVGASRVFTGIGFRATLWTQGLHSGRPWITREDYSAYRRGTVTRTQSIAEAQFLLHRIHLLWIRVVLFSCFLTTAEICAIYLWVLPPSKQYSSYSSLLALGLLRSSQRFPARSVSPGNV